VGPYPGDRVAHVGYLVGECRVRLQPVIRAYTDEAAPAGQVPDQRPCFAGLIAGVEAASMEVQQDRRAGRPAAAVVYVQHAARPVAAGKAAHPDHVVPARENGARKIRPHGRSGLPALCNAACARSARHVILGARLARLVCCVDRGQAAGDGRHPGPQFGGLDDLDVRTEPQELGLSVLG
jgi:hypothetical protein